jgi:hypothetical protein
MCMLATKINGVLSEGFDCGPSDNKGRSLHLPELRHYGKIWIPGHISAQSSNGSIVPKSWSCLCGARMNDRESGFGWTRQLRVCSNFKILNKQKNKI